MTGIVNEVHARVKARIWQAIAQSGMDLSALPKETVEKLVDLTTESALLEMDAQFGRTLEDLKSSAPVLVAGGAGADLGGLDEGERVLWEGRPLLSLTRHYRITSERVRITTGLLGKEREDIELLKIQDIDQSQTFGERILNIGDITIRSHDPSHPEVILENVTDVQRVHEIVRRAMLDARQRANFAYREEM